MTKTQKRVLAYWRSVGPLARPEIRAQLVASGMLPKAAK